MELIYRVSDEGKEVIAHWEKHLRDVVTIMASHGATKVQIFDSLEYRSALKELVKVKGIFERPAYLVTAETAAKLQKLLDENPNLKLF